MCGVKADIFRGQPAQVPSPDKVRFLASTRPSRAEGSTASRVKRVWRAASGLSEAGKPPVMSDTMSLQVTVVLSSSSLPSVSSVLTGFLPFLPGGVHGGNNWNERRTNVTKLTEKKS
ncbi:MAG: hypothetical protein HFH69_13110 [Lachnospiraceae bacterium]|nr:hypothetical protein [Lachnospiraceae bacterium]